MSHLQKIVCIFLLSFTGIGSAQTAIEFCPVFSLKPFTLDKYYLINKSDSFKIESLKFYISSVHFLKDAEVVFREENSYHLVDLTKPNTLRILSIPQEIDFTHIGFNLGIDSVTNVSGALGGDLDPTLAMYWTWQSGYINVKVEGKSNLCSTHKNEFALHLGGYQKTNLSLQQIQLKINSPRSIVIELDFFKFLQTFDLAKQNQIMSPGNDAVLLSKKFAQIFSIR